MSDVIRVLLVDDHAVLRAGLRLLLEDQKEFKVIGEASTGLAALALAEELNPDLILLDLSMPGLGGLDALPTLKQVAPRARILILTMHDDTQYLRRALEADASGYILKKAADVELISAMQAVIRGEVYVDPAVTRPLLEDLLPLNESDNVKDLWETLSNREQQVLKLVALGHTSVEIAERLSLSSKTVETYRKRGLEKLQIHTRAALVRFTLERGLLSPDDY
jgi:two-component system response regulator NreC